MHQRLRGFKRGRDPFTCPTKRDTALEGRAGNGRLFTCINHISQVSATVPIAYHYIPFNKRPLIKNTSKKFLADGMD